MFVVNKEDGIPVCVEVNKVKYVIPGDRRRHFLPDEAYSLYKDLFYIVVPPAPKTSVPKFIPLDIFKKVEKSKIEEITIEPKRVNNKKGNPNWSRYEYEITDPEGKVVVTNSITKFFKNLGLRFDMYYSACRKGETYKGWKIIRRLKETKD